MGIFKTNAKEDGVKSDGQGCTQKQPCPGVMPSSGAVANQMTPRMERRQDYTPTPQPREQGVRY